MTNSNHISNRVPGRVGRLAAVLALALLAAMVAAGVARADLNFDHVGVSLNQAPRLNPDGTPMVNADGTFVDPLFERRAGSHPDLEIGFKVETGPDGKPVEALRTFDVDLPKGLVGNPKAVSSCAPEDLINPGVPGADCAMTSQVGYAEIVAWGPNGRTNFSVAVFNIAHGTDVPARFGFNFNSVVGLINARVRPDDYGISSGGFSLSQGEYLESARVIIWGVPADRSHDTMRQNHRLALNVNDFNKPQVPAPNISPLSLEPPAKPLLSLPSTCSEEPLSFTVRGDSWENPDKFDERTLTADEDGTPFVFEGCERLSFNPSAVVRPLAHTADSPSGLDVDITVPQPQDAYGLAPSHVRNVRTVLPKGVSVNASSAAGLGSCSLAQIKLGSNDAPTCPASSRLGSVEIETPVLDETLQGDVFLAKQNENPFDSLLALYISVKGPGFNLKLPGKIEVDSNTGQLTTVVTDNPQLPFEHLSLNLNGGPFAALSLPRACGTYVTKTEFTSWSGGAPVISESPFQVNEGCDTGGFAPGFQAGTVDPAAGGFSPFVLRITRNDGEQNLAKLTATLPQGLLAKLAGVPLCGDAQAATGACPAGSQVGSVTVGAGSGTNPLYVPQPGKAPTAAYLAGPYKGAPYSMVVKVPAQAGPFDLGTVTVRNALNVDPSTAQVTAVSDPLPQILQGIPIAYRSVQVEVNRPEFTLNPTNCDKKAVTSRLTSTTGQTADPSARFRATECGELGFGPSLQIAFKGGMKRTGNPALTATLKAPKGDANIAKTTVVLPKSEFIDNAHINNPCTRVQFNENACPASSILGTATATSPLLDQPLSGPVYFRSNGGERELPDLVADLNGPIHVTLVGFIDSKKGGVRTRFQNVPDAPVSKFVLKMKGGKQGLIQNSRNLCSFTPKAKVQMTGQNGKPHNFAAKIATSCGKK